MEISETTTWVIFHHGNIATNKPISYSWKIPDTIPDGDTCVLRLRYNMSESGDMVVKSGNEESSSENEADDLIQDSLQILQFSVHSKIKSSY